VLCDAVDIPIGKEWSGCFAAVGTRQTVKFGKYSFIGLRKGSIEIVGANLF